MKAPVQKEDGGSTLASSLQIMHDAAGQHFKKNPLKCYQRHIRELYATVECRKPLPSLEGAIVERISFADAKSIIIKYEWLRTMGMGTGACYGLKIQNELIGVACFGRIGVKKICGTDSDEQQHFLKKTAYLMRGACVPHAPKNAASFLIRKSCFLARKDFGWQIFMAYSDHDAGEIGTVYQASNWFYLGTALCQTNANHKHSDFRSPDGKTIWSSYKINHHRVQLVRDINAQRKSEGHSDDLAPEEKGFFRPWLLKHGWTEIIHRSNRKGVYVWFEGTPEERNYLKSRIRYKIYPYPKRETK